MRTFKGKGHLRGYMETNTVETSYNTYMEAV